MKDSHPATDPAAGARTPASNFGLRGDRARPATAGSVVLAVMDASHPSLSLQRAAALAHDLGAALHVVRVLPEAAVGSALTEQNVTKILRSVERTLSAHRDLRAWIRAALPSGGAVRCCGILHGEFVERVARYAAEVDARLILVPPEEDGASGLVAGLARATRTSAQVTPLGERGEASTQAAALA